MYFTFSNINKENLALYEEHIHEIMHQREGRRNILSETGKRELASYELGLYTQDKKVRDSVLFLYRK